MSPFRSNLRYLISYLILQFVIDHGMVMQKVKVMCRFEIWLISVPPLLILM